MLSLQSLNLIEESFVFSNCWGHRSYCLDFSWSHVRSWWVVSSSYCYVGKIQLFQPITATENNSVFCIFSCLAKYDCFNRLQIISQFLVFSVAWYNTIVSTATATDHILVFSILSCLAQYDCFNWLLWQILSQASGAACVSPFAWTVWRWHQIHVKTALFTFWHLFENSDRF